jgi:ribosome biogenesis protein Nip4
LQTRKNPLITYSSPDRNEAKQIQSKLAEFISEEALAALFKDQQVLLSRGRRIEAYLLSMPLLKFVKNIERTRFPYFVGLYLGDLEKYDFTLSLHILPFLIPHLNNHRMIEVTTKGEQRFLYGHDLHHVDITKPIIAINQAREVIVVNTMKHGLGYGYYQPRKTPVLKNQRDLGWYLRRGK